jgi:predicted permease
VAAYSVYLIFALSTLAFGTLLLTNLTNLGRYLAWALVGWSTLMALLATPAKSRLDHYLTRMQELDLKRSA